MITENITFKIKNTISHFFLLFLFSPNFTCPKRGFDMYLFPRVMTRTANISIEKIIINIPNGYGSPIKLPIHPMPNPNNIKPK